MEAEMPAPTEAEIREALHQRSAAHPSDDPLKALRAAVEDFGAFMSGPAFEVLESPDPRDPGDDYYDIDDIWGRDLRPSEAKALELYFLEAVEQATSDALAAITDAYVDHALRFAAEFADAPRAVRETVPASRRD